MHILLRNIQRLYSIKLMLVYNRLCFYYTYFLKKGSDKYVGCKFWINYSYICTWKQILLRHLSVCLLHSVESDTAMRFLLGYITEKKKKKKSSKFNGTLPEREIASMPKSQWSPWDILPRMGKDASFLQLCS